MSVSDDNSPRGSDDNISRSSEPEPGALLDPYPSKETGLSMKLEKRGEISVVCALSSGIRVGTAVTHFWSTVL